jgi:hypothetical protein
MGEKCGLHERDKNAHKFLDMNIYRKVTTRKI